VLFTGDTLLGAILIAAALGFWLGEYYGKRTARPRVSRWISQQASEETKETHTPAPVSYTVRRGG